MKTRKIFGYGIAVIFAFVLALAFTACEEAHTHSYSTAWSYDATQHWHECTDNDGAKTDVANHNYNAASVCSVCGYDGKAALYGTWICTTGTYQIFQPFTLTITANSVKWEDKDGDYIQYADVVWTAAENTNPDNKANYPNGYTLTGTRTYQLYSFSFGFIALSTDGQSVYLGEDASEAFDIWADPIYTKQ